MKFRRIARKYFGIQEWWTHTLDETNNQHVFQGDDADIVKRVSVEDMNAATVREMETEQQQTKTPLPSMLFGNLP